MALTPTTKLKTAGGTLSGQLNFSGTTHAGIKLLSLTTTQRNALTAANGMLIYNTTTATVQKYEAGAWVDVSAGSAPAAHASTHQNNGADEISVAGLSGLLADGQTPLAHIVSHAPGGSDALPWTTIHGRGTTGAKPAAAAGNAGYLYFDTTLTKLQRSTGSAWEDVAEPGATTSYSLTATTTDATQTELLTSAAARLTLPDNTAWGFTALFTGRYNGTGGTFATWTARDSNRDWSSITSSSDGTKLAALVYNGQIYVSSNSGVTWTARGSSRIWYSIASSSDGTKIAAAYNGGVEMSSDSGVTWTGASLSLGAGFITSSADGTKLAVAFFGTLGVNLGELYVSSDSGATWTARESSRNWHGIASSSDGTKLAAAAYGGQIYTSTSAATPAASETCEFKGHAVRDSGAASMAISALQENPIGDNTAGRFTCQADLTNGALQFLATGAAAQTWKWGVSVQTVEVTP